jgi:hypothetical protein
VSRDHGSGACLQAPPSCSPTPPRLFPFTPHPGRIRGGKTWRRVGGLPDGRLFVTPNSYTGCIGVPTAAPAEVAGGEGNNQNGKHPPVTPGMVEMLPRLASAGPPPFLRGYFAGPKSAGVYSPGGFAWANQISDFGDGGRETKSLNLVQGQVRGRGAPPFPASHGLPCGYKQKALPHGVGGRWQPTGHLPAGVGPRQRACVDPPCASPRPRPRPPPVPELPVPGPLQVPRRCRDRGGAHQRRGRGRRLLRGRGVRARHRRAQDLGRQRWAGARAAGGRGCLAGRQGP